MKLYYFAWVREKVGVKEEVLTPPEGVRDLAGLIAWLKERSPAHAEALADPRMVRVAINQNYVAGNPPVGPEDEIAFFPPVTGGAP
ncbi:MAG: molybdopterin converting factor subunit 1 [Alphaproteobacteria bacterium]|nr:molybdopterin converting factor subunit 1 [Alphaproteobacteria bacterium]